MQIEVKFFIDDEVYTVNSHHWDNEKRVYCNFIVEKYRIRSISISCNSKGEWKKSYRAQLVVNGKTVDYGFNFKEESVGDSVFTSYNEAKERCDAINSDKRQI